MEAVDQADLIMTVGYDIAEYPPDNWNPDADKTIIHMDFDQAEVYDHYQPEVEIVADISASLEQMADRIGRSSCTFDTEWFEGTRKRILEDIDSYRLKEGDSFHTPGALNVIREALPDKGLLISDVGSHKMWIARNYPTYTPNGCIISNGLASMGISVPGGIAADLAVDAEVVAATGDGGFLMNGAEIETATRVGCGYTILLFVDDDYGLISEKQHAHRGESFGTRLTNPDFMTLAESFGIEGYRPKEWDELEETLREALLTDEMSLVEIPLG
jgi:acetolactate synthase-1/2/3 large subunit